MVSGFLGVFLLVGMLFWHTLVVAVVINASYFASMIYAGVPADVMQFEIITLVALSTIALVFVYYLEHSQRETFLQRQVLRDLSERDALTGLRNRGAFDTAFDERWRQALRDRQQIGLLIIDVDHFKAFNDHYGHQAGDRCLEKIGKILERPERRPLDLAARIGGEEFAVLLYGATQPHVTQVAEQLLRAVRLAGMPHEKSPVSDRVTVSIGAGVIRPTVGRTPAGLIQYVDEALYLAKRGGRDRIVFPDKSYETLVTGSFKVEQDTGAES
jgi:diguanylate cyclase (GGDEF)-like protein